jgi:D-alanyl-lipoteichoic acid acyltransferase DltB (MBOAT superfamily)
MIFSSTEFIFIFLPVVFFGYFLFNYYRKTIAGKAWLVAVSLFFYAYWNVIYLPLLLASITFNYVVGRLILPSGVPLPISRRSALTVGIIINLLLLGYFKYSNFFLENIDFVFNTKHAFPRILLPLGVSFFTFTQIAFLVDSYKGKASDYDVLNYSLFVTFFPHLIAGPILHHQEMMVQFRSDKNLALKYSNIASGFFIFSIGFFKKIVLADTFAIWSNKGFDGASSLDFFSAWGASLSYTFQIYFDFSGYCDMAIGASLLFNIWLPINFNSPYKALNIQDFWRRWHITLSRFLRDYVYIPLGGNLCSIPRVYFNVVVTFLLGGLWHGASWMFVIWGAMHGAALVIHRIWHRLGLRMPGVFAWLITFVFVNITWVFFRAKSISDALRILYGMADFSSIFHGDISIVQSDDLAWGGSLIDLLLKYLPVGLVANILCYYALTGALLIIFQRNSYDLMMQGQLGYNKIAAAILIFSVAFYTSMISASQVFIYFNF